METTQLKGIAKTAQSLIQNHKAIDAWLSSIVWVAATPDKKVFAEEMKKLDALRKEGKRIQKSLEKALEKLEPKGKK